jgi:hypothetical protein
MFWIVQSNLYKEESFKELVRLLTLMDIPHILVKPLPFSLRFTYADTDLNGQNLEQVEEPIIDSNQNIMVCGAYTLAKIAKDRGWKPGAFLNDNFEYNVWIENWGKENMLNGGAITSAIKDLKVPETWNRFFTRPTEDTKSFAGKIFQRDDFISWMNQVKSIKGFSTLTPETPVMIAPIQDIHAEYRLFVVDKKIITGSLYKIREQVIYNALLDDNVVAFANEMIQTWQPDRAFVIDIAVTPEGYKIIEINNINSSGFYASDLAKFIMAIEDMKF